MRRVLLPLLGLIFLIGLVWAPPASAATVSKSLTAAISGLPVVAEDRTGYDRDLFPLWSDTDGDGCNTRYEVLIAEAVTTPTVGSGCSLSSLPKSMARAG